MIDVLGWVGAMMLAVCAVPQAWLSWRQGHARGVSDGLIWLWMFGEIFTLIYIASKDTADLPLLFNYTANIFFVAVIIKYRYWPREN